MEPKDIIYEMQLRISETFESQDSDLFDVVFKVEGKNLYADKFHLSIISSTFYSMLSERWTSKNDAILINDYSFNDFKRLLTFIYSGKCELNDENIFTMIDIAEFYQVKELKDKCDEYFSKMEYNLQNVFKLLEISNKYSMSKMKKSLDTFIYQCFYDFVKCDELKKANKFVIEEFLTLQSYPLKQEEVFQAIYEWAEYQATVKNESNDEKFDMNDVIKAELKEFLPYIQFKEMSLNFLIKYVVVRGFLIPYKELSDILDAVYSNVKVKITNSLQKSIYGILPCNSDVVEIIKSLKGRSSDNPFYPTWSTTYFIENDIYWNLECKIPTTPSSLTKRNGIEWYLIYFSSGSIGLKHYSKISTTDYLIAEMSESKEGFSVTNECKIEIE